MEEQRYIVGIMKHGEQLLEKQGEIREVLQKILYQAMYHQVREALAKKQTLPLGNFFIEPISDGKDVEDKKISEAYPQMMGELLFQNARMKMRPIFVYFLKNNRKKYIILIVVIWRVRIHKEKLIPEFLLLWVYYGRDCLGIDFYEGKHLMNQNFLMKFPVPRVAMEVQKKIGNLVKRAENIDRKLEEQTEGVKRLYHSLLYSSFTAFL